MSSFLSVFSNETFGIVMKYTWPIIILLIGSLCAFSSGKAMEKDKKHETFHWMSYHLSWFQIYYGIILTFYVILITVFPVLNLFSN